MSLRNRYARSAPHNVRSTERPLSVDGGVCQLFKFPLNKR